jgi:hypothetical protein
MLRCVLAHMHQGIANTYMRRQDPVLMSAELATHGQWEDKTEALGEERFPSSEQSEST